MVFSQDYASTQQRPVVEEVELQWNSPEVESWKAAAREVQQNIYEMLGGDQMEPGLYSIQNRTDLERKVAYAIYGPPSQLPNRQLNAGTGYKKKQLKAVRKTCSVILKQTGHTEVFVLFLFVCIKIPGGQLVSPLFRVAAEIKNDIGEYEENVFYVDGSRRVYKGWIDYIKNNKLPKCFMCYPQNGIYTATNSRVDVEFGESPACNLSGKVLDAVDITLTLVVTALGITALVVPVSAPVAIAAVVGGVASGVFALGRNTRTLVDRHRHGQTLGLNSGEARASWMGVVGSTVGISLGSVSMVASRIVQGTRLAGLKVGVASLSIGATTMKGLTILNHFANIGKKIIDNAEVTPLDAFQVVSSVYFFSGSVVSTQTAFGALVHLKAAGVDLKMAEVLQTVRTRSALSAEVLGVTNSARDGEDTIEEPEMLWPKSDESYWRCSIL
jgi:hypothetical protein